ncbi:unnamed protein product [Prorocentrum cordatum]|uniref:Fructose-bisphosphate aldolase n=1 Tax=Prorocentrum cordatum TaxID=2364126 RepID=A0ABN9QWZ5_9DINO|nr:unnamed protein product [Polarella glacialis]
MGEREANDGMIMWGRLQTSTANMQKSAQKLGAPPSNNIAAWKGRTTSMKEFYEGMDKLARLRSRDGGTDELLGKAHSAGPLITLEVEHCNKTALDRIRANVAAEGATNNASAFTAGGPPRMAIESAPKGICAAPIEMGAEEERLRARWPMSVAAPGWSMHNKDEHDFAELITTSTGTMEIEILAAAGPKPPKPRRG